MDYSRNGNYQSTRKLRRHKSKRGKNFWLGVFIMIGLFWFFQSKNSDIVKEEKIVAGVATTASTSSPTPTPSPSPKSYRTLQDTIDKSLEGTAGSYGVVVKNLKTGESYSLNESKTFGAGSLYKLWTMGTTFKIIETGELAEDEKLSQGIAVLNRKFGIAPADAEQTQGTLTLTVNEALHQMITISHNYAALLLTEKLKLSQVALWLESNNFNNSKVGTDGATPTTTPSDIAIFYEKLYKGELGNPDSTTKMIELLKKQQLNNKLPKNLPPNTVIAHKTGELGWFTHDAGIIYSEKGDYLIVAMSESSSPKGAEERIAQLSADIFRYFQSKR